MAAKNLLIAQSGGPSPVINTSLRGLVETARLFPEKVGKVYAGWHGIEGVLNEELFVKPLFVRKKLPVYTL